MRKTSTFSWVIMMVLMMSQLISCKKEENAPEVLASFTYVVGTVDFKQVTFTNTSQNFSLLSWNFGDESALSSETNPVHTYADLGTYTVTLTASSKNGKNTDTYSTDIVISDPNAELTKLVGEVSKTWKLLRVTTTGRYPLECGPWDHSTIWWAPGLGNDEIANRPCMYNDEWIFTRDGLGMTYDPKGDYWAEGGIFDPANVCAETSSMVGVNGEDLSAWDGGDFTFVLATGASPKLTVNGEGAFVGFFKLINGREVMKNADYTTANPIVIPTTITYNIIKLYDGDVDTLIVEGQYKWDAGDGGYWRFCLVHYDDPADEPPIPSHMPSAGFNMTVDGSTITCTNTSQFATSYSWDFGNGETATTTDATYTYPDDGFYIVKLTATNANGSSTTTQPVLVSGNTPALTDVLLQGPAWKILIGDKTTIFVGSGMGKADWWQVPLSFLDGSTTGGDDWSCITDDEFTFSAGGVYTYNTNGTARNDGWWGDPHGCVSDATITASANYGPAFGSGTHSYTFTEASGDDRAVIELTNGASGAAFIGFYKGYYGGENTNSANPPNGGNTTNRYEVMGYAQGATYEYLFVTVDISADHSSGASWSAILYR